MSIGLYRTAAEDAAIGGRAAYSAMEFLQEVQGLRGNATIKVGTRQRFHSADGVYNRDRTLRETREAFRQAIVSTFGAAGEEALRKVFDGVNARPLSARMIRQVFSEAQILASRRALDETRDRNGANVFDQIIDEQLQAVMPEMETIFAADGNAQPFTDEMKSAARAFCLRDLHQTFAELIAQKRVGHQVVDESLLGALAEKARESLKRCANRMNIAVDKLRSDGVDLAQAFSRPDLTQAMLLSDKLEVSLRFLDHFKAHHRGRSAQVTPERLLRHLEVRLGRTPTRHPVDAADKLAGVFDEYITKLRSDVKKELARMNLTEEISIKVDELCDSSALIIGGPVRLSLCQWVEQRLSSALEAALMKEFSTPSALGEEKWADLQTRVLHRTALEGLVRKEIGQQVGTWLHSHPGLDRDSMVEMAGNRILRSPVGRRLMDGDSHDAMRELGRVRDEIRSKVEDFLVKKEADRVSLAETLTQLPIDIKATLTELGYQTLASEVDCAPIVEGISLANGSPEKTARLAKAFLNGIRDAARLMEEAKLAPAVRTALLRDLFRDKHITPVNIVLAVQIYNQGRLAGDCGFSQLNANSSPEDVKTAFLGFGHLLQEGLGGRVVTDTFERAGNRLAVMHLLILLHPEIVKNLSSLPPATLEAVYDALDERHGELAEALAGLPGFVAMRTEQQRQADVALKKEIMENENARDVVLGLEELLSW